MLPIKETELATFAPIAPVGEPPRAKYERLIMTAKKVPPATTVVVHPCEETSLRGAVDAAEAGIIKPILVGPAAKIASVAREFQLDIARYEVIDAPHSDIAAARGVQLIHEGKGELLMKGSLHTDELMREVTSAKNGLRTSRRISHVFIMDVPTHVDTATPATGIGKLVAAKLLRKAVTSHIGLNPETQRQMMAGELEVKLVPQGTLVERIRAGGYGLGGVLTPTGLEQNGAGDGRRYGSGIGCQARRRRDAAYREGATG